MDFQFSQIFSISLSRLWYPTFSSPTMSSLVFWHGTSNESWLCEIHEWLRDSSLFSTAWIVILCSVFWSIVELICKKTYNILFRRQNKTIRKFDERNANGVVKLCNHWNSSERHFLPDRREARWNFYMNLTCSNSLRRIQWTGKRRREKPYKNTHIGTDGRFPQESRGFRVNQAWSSLIANEKHEYPSRGQKFLHYW